MTMCKMNRLAKDYHYAILIDSLWRFCIGDRDKEVDIVVQYAQKAEPILIEVKYREESPIPEKDMIVELSSNERPNLVITKRTDDFGLCEYKGDKRIYKLPASVFLYLLGYVESLDY